MNHVSKLIFVTLISTFALNSSFGQTDTIELNLNPGTETLHDPGTIKVYKGETVYWKIKASENIRSFNVKGAGHPFTMPPPDPNNDYIWIKRVVQRDGPYEWKYKIFYRLRSNPGRRREIDPKIAVKPSPIAPTPIIILLGLLVMTITSIVFFSLWRVTAGKLAKQITAAKPATNDPRNR